MKKALCKQKPTPILLVCIVMLLFIIGGWRFLFTEAQQLYFQLTDHNDSTQKLSRIDAFTFNAPSLNDDEREMRVYIPQAYDREPHGKFPVLYMLHGDPGNSEDWLINADFQDTLDTLIAQKEVEPMIVVFPDGRGIATQDSQYVNATKLDQRMEDFVVSDVVHEIDQRYRTLAVRGARGLGGASSGGYAALNIGIHHPNTFGVLASFSGYFINNEWVVQTLFGNDQKAKQRNNPLVTLDQYKLQPAPSVFLQVGDTDYPTFIAQNRQLESKLKKYGIPHTLVFTEGSHGWEMWKQSLPNGLEYISAQFQKN